METIFDRELKFLPGVGPKKAELLNYELGVTTLEDIIFYFPFKYIDRTKFYKTTELFAENSFIQIKGKIKSFSTEGQGRKERLKAQFSDNYGTIELIWFQGVSWIKSKYIENKEYIVFGKVSVFNRKCVLIHPDIYESTNLQNQDIGQIQPYYNTSEKMKKAGLNSKNIEKIIQIALSIVNGYINETLSNYLIKKYNLILLKDALVKIHKPINFEDLQKAQLRLKFEELFYIQLKIIKQKFSHKKLNKGYIFEKVGNNLNNFYHNNLPFELTNSQKRVLKEIRQNTNTGVQMNRLLQGDVGSGKTLVALMTMLIAMDNGFQSCMMAPTEILAIQHYNTIAKFLKGANINFCLLTGSTKTKERRTISERLENGEMNIIVGTHALIEDKVKFQNLGMVVIDEQHKFGVAQRSRLWSKSERMPHILVMSATPIPRTLAMTLYGDLDVSIIDELPPGRKPVKTYHYFDSQQLKVYDFMKKQIDLGKQIFIVYPLIEESEKMDLKDVQDGYDTISRHFPAPKYSIGMVHGKLKNEEKEETMKMFAKGLYDILISTTVIEVGVDIPNATVMIIQNANRFGLSQLHQLRGRVGRGSDESYCILMTGFELGKEAKIRIYAMCKSNDGFEIAEIDLKLRGPGDIEGTQQSGISINFKIANITKDYQIMQLARDSAEEILEQDPELQKNENQIFVEQLKKIKNSQKNWIMIS